MNIHWEGILGQEENIGRLRQMLREGKLPHALLFTGPEGVGKCRAAQALAAALLCEHEDGPCGTCPSCRALEQDSHPDYYEVRPEGRGKAAPVIRIEQVRNMQSEIARLPLLSKGRVVVMDGADHMNEAAENCLLKTLEEPVGQVTFLLVASSRTSLLDTIISRCVPMTFRMLPVETMVKLLRERCIPEDEARELALLSDGSMGRALALHERGGLKLRDDAREFLEQLGQMDMEAVWRRGKAMGDMDRERLSEWFMYLNMLLRDMLVLYDGGDSGLIYHQGSRSELLSMLPEFPEGRIFSLLAVVKEYQRRLRANVNLRLLMEGFLIRFKELAINKF